MARVILDMAREEGRRLKDGRIAFRRATHQEIANRIGTTRETVTRMLKDLERQGLIHVDGKEMIVGPRLREGVRLGRVDPLTARAADASCRLQQAQQVVLDAGADRLVLGGGQGQLPHLHGLAPELLALVEVREGR